MDEFTFINGYYTTHDEDARFSSKHGRVEFLTTTRYIDKYLFPGAKILEIGAGTGRYSHHYARLGYEVDAVELIPHNIEVFRTNTRPDERVTIRQGDARALTDIPSDTYDITLLLGPMYHLFTERDQMAALSEAIRATKPGGVIYAAYTNNDATMITFCFGRNVVLEYMRAGMIDPVTFKCKSEPKEVFALYVKREIDDMMARLPVDRLHYVGTDMATNFMRDTVDNMDDEVYDVYLNYHYSICERPELVGATHHMLDVFRKRA